MSANNEESEGRPLINTLAFNPPLEISNRVETSLPKLSNTVKFLSPANTNYLVKKAFDKFPAKGYIYYKFSIPRKMKEWARVNDINNFTFNSQKFFTASNWVQAQYVETGEDILYHINKEFIKDMIDLASANKEINVFRQKVPVNGKLKKYSEMYVNDIRNLDVWGEQSVELNNSNYRYFNEIPVWQKSMSTRHINAFGNSEECVEGLRYGQKRSSLIGQTRGYDMSNIILEKDLKAIQVQSWQPEFGS
jgi:hypothetical protein